MRMLFRVARPVLCWKQKGEGWRERAGFSRVGQGGALARRASHKCFAIFRRPPCIAPLGGVPWPVTPPGKLKAPSQARGVGVARIGARRPQETARPPHATPVCARKRAGARAPVPCSSLTFRPPPLTPLPRPRSSRERHRQTPPVLALTLGDRDRAWSVGAEAQNARKLRRGREPLSPRPGPPPPSPTPPHPHTTPHTPHHP